MGGAPVSRRDDILAIAARLFAEHGFDRTTMREIAADCGIQAASLYHHFATKDEILHGLIRDFVVGLPAIYRRLIAENRDPAAIIRAFVGFALRIALGERHRLAIVIRERKALVGRPAYGYVDQALHEVRTLWLGVLNDGIAKGVFRTDLNPHVVVRMMMDLVGSAAEWYRPDSARYSPDEVVATELAFILGGIGTRET